MAASLVTEFSWFWDVDNAVHFPDIFIDRLKRLVRAKKLEHDWIDVFQSEPNALDVAFFVSFLMVC